MERLIWFSQILCLSFMSLQFRVQSSTPSQSSPDSPPHLCRPEERSSLLDFKSTTDGLETWNKSIDCCLWEGITCDETIGHVIGLDLSGNYIHANLTTNSSLFRLKNLQSLSLAINYFDFPNISFGLHRWKSLTYLDLSDSGNMDGSLLSEISLLEKLVSLNLSYNSDLHLDSTTFQMLVHNLTELRFLILDDVNVSSILPSSLLNLTSSLEHLSLSDCSLQGNFPSQVFHLPSLQLLDLSSNYDLEGNLPESNWSSPLKYLSLRYTSFSGELPHSIGNLKLLEELDLFSCQFGGEIPTSIFNLTHLSSLSLASNKLIGTLPHNISGLSSLSLFDMSDNSITGRVPSWLFSLSALSFLHLENNRLTGPIDHIEKPSLIFREVYLSNNEISGSIPSFFSDLVNLVTLDLSSNNLSGTITPNMLSNLANLYVSNNSLLSLNNNDTSANYSFPSLQSLRLSSCNIHKFPSFLRKAERLLVLDISQNKIFGHIHRWEIEGMSLLSLNLSYNFLTGIDLSGLGFHSIVDLRSNLLQGSLPILSTNGFGTLQLFISANNLTGEIPSSYCKLTSLLILDLAHNSLGAKIPECLGNLSDLFVLDLQMNKFHGRIPNSFINMSKLKALKLNGNQLEGRLPSSLVNCSDLEVLDVGNNYLNDTFPHWLGVLPRLKILILRSNRFHGVISNSMPTFYFPLLRIIDVSQNDFMGLLPSNYFKNLISMKDVPQADKAKLEYIGYMEDCSHGCRGLSSPINLLFSYEDSVKVVMKGLEVKLERILKIFTSIDFSSNQFHGPIPEELGELSSLLLLNLSHNSFTSQIPSSLGKMAELESLDLSSNKLEGRIPEQLTNLTFLSVLKLSHNQLVGNIPKGKQFNTFSNDSYIGNSGLCGFPLTKKCHNESEPGKPPPKFDEEDDSATLFNWKFAAAGYGCGLVLGLSLGYIAFTTRKPWWVVKKVEKYQEKFVGRFNRKYKGRTPHKSNQHS